MINEGEKAPDFKGVDQSLNPICLADFKGKKLILYFYPRDDTPGCTVEACDFRDHHADFEALGAEIVGVSGDDAHSHQSFISKYNLPFRLLVDENKKVCQTYGVIKDKNMYGRIFKGIERSTFLINENGIILKIWRNVKVSGHIEDLLTTLQKYSGKV